MLPKQFRLPATTHFRSSRTLSTPLFTLKIQENNLLVNRYGIVISKKVEPTAVGRNRAKRQVRSIIESGYLSAKGKDVLCIAKKPLLHATREEIAQVLDQILSSHV